MCVCVYVHTYIYMYIRIYRTISINICVRCLCACRVCHVCVGVGSHMCVCPTSESSPLTLRAHPFQKNRGAQRRASWQQASVNFFLRVASASVLPLPTQEPWHPFSHIQYDGRFTSPLGAYEKCVSKKFFEPPLVLCYYRNLRTPPFRALPRF